MFMWMWKISQCGYVLSRLARGIAAVTRNKLEVKGGLRGGALIVGSIDCGVNHSVRDSLLRADRREGLSSIVSHSVLLHPE